jgi:AraC-like DNA-binding protein
VLIIILSIVQHIEFFHNDHFQNDYFRKKPKKSLTDYIDFYWETDFEKLFRLYPEGFSDALFPNIGYTYLINLGTPYVMQLEEKKFNMKSDGFLPRNKNMICHHSAGNKLFGIKFKVSPVLFEKKINFSEYREFIFPLSYLIDKSVLQKIKSLQNFYDRVAFLNNYYEKLISNTAHEINRIRVVTECIRYYSEKGNFDLTITELADKNNISSKTLQRYFMEATSISGKKALQIIRIRRAIEHLTKSPTTFNVADFGYYDYSHFYKHLKLFVGSHMLVALKPHLYNHQALVHH